MATYGIDLGTTYSCIAYVDGTGRPVVLKSAVGEDTTPSVVYFESADNVVVGRQAKDSAVLAPHLVVELVKRQMGEDVHYSFHGQDHTPESISALILRELAQAARAADRRGGPGRGDHRPGLLRAAGARSDPQGRADRRPERARRPRRTGGRRPQLPGAGLSGCRGPARGAAHLHLRPGRRDLRHHGHPYRRRRHSGHLYRRQSPPGRRRLGQHDHRLPAARLHRAVPAARSGRRRAVHAGPRDLSRAAEEGAERHPDAQAQCPVRRFGRAARTDQGAPRRAHLRVARAHHADHRADDRDRAGEGRRPVRRRAPGGRYDHHSRHRADAQGARSGSTPGCRIRTWPWPRARRCSL